MFTYKPYNDNYFNSDYSVGYHRLTPFRISLARLFDDEVYSSERRFTVSEEDDSYTFSLELPGYKQSHLDVSIEGDVLTVTAKKEESSYSNSVTIPEGVDSEKTEAKLEDGILTIKLFKAEQSKPRKITVK